MVVGQRMPVQQAYHHQKNEQLCEGGHHIRDKHEQLESGAAGVRRFLGRLHDHHNALFVLSVSERQYVLSPSLSSVDADWLMFVLDAP